MGTPEKRGGAQCPAPYQLAELGRSAADRLDPVAVEDLRRVPRLPAERAQLIQGIGDARRAPGLVDDLDARQLVARGVGFLDVLEAEADRADRIHAPNRDIVEVVLG